MGLILLFLMIVVPIVEIAVFIQVGGWMGLWPTLATVVLTAMAGTALLRQQGFATLMRARDNLAAGRFPVAEVFDGLCLVVAGALLLTPGFVTDAVGLLLFVPGLRAYLRRHLSHYLATSGRVQVFSDGRTPPGGPGPQGPGAGQGPAPGGGPVIDGEFEEVDRRKRPDDRNRGNGNPWNRDDS